MAIPFGWRWAFVAAAALTVAAAVAPSWTAEPAAAARPRRRRGLTSVHALGLAAVLASAAGVGFVSFLVSYAVDSGMSEGAAGLLLGGVSLMATCSRIGVGLFADRAGQEPLRPVAAMLTASVGGYLLLISGGVRRHRPGGADSGRARLGLARRPQPGGGPAGRTRRPGPSAC